MFKSEYVSLLFLILVPGFGRVKQDQYNFAIEKPQFQAQGEVFGLPNYP